VLDPKLPDDYFLFVANDNDFLTQDGFQVGAPTSRRRRRRRHMFLVYRSRFPASPRSKPSGHTSQPGASGRKKVHVEQAWRYHRGPDSFGLLPSCPPWDEKMPTRGAPAT